MGRKPVLVALWLALIGTPGAVHADNHTDTDDIVQSPAQDPRVLIETSAGNMMVELHAGRAPITVARFLELVDEGAYAGTIFHRVIPAFMIQGGGYMEDLQPVPERSLIVNEADNGLTNVRGTLAMARLDEIDSASMQFFINVEDNPHLDHTDNSCSRADEAQQSRIEARGLVKPRTCGTFGYAVFGRVVDGMDVVDRIEIAPTRETESFESLPLEPVVIRKMKRTL